jgi:glycosyltransferase involved in cell wall biosynthesis
MGEVQNIGLMLTRNEEDVIAEVMDANQKYFDKILVLDGSSDRTAEIVRSYDCVKYFLKDTEMLDKLPNHKFEDGARQFLLEKAQAMFPVEGWFTLLHGDEIWHDDPNWVAAEAEKAHAQKVNWYVMNFSSILRIRGAIWRRSNRSSSGSAGTAPDIWRSARSRTSREYITTWPSATRSCRRGSAGRSTNISRSTSITRTGRCRRS